MNTTENHPKLASKLKRKAFLPYHNDGIIDILIGWNLAVTGVSLYLHKLSPLSGFIALAPLFLYMPLKLMITFPRLGHAQFRTRRTFAVWLAGAVGGVFLLAALIYGFFIDSPSGFVGPVALILLGIALMMVFISGFNRILAYAVFIPLYFIVGFGLHFLSPEMIIGTGGLLILVGVWLLVRFLRTYPIQVEEENFV